MSTTYGPGKLVRDGRIAVSDDGQRILVSSHDVPIEPRHAINLGLKLIEAGMRALDRKKEEPAPSKEEPMQYRDDSHLVPLHPRIEEHLTKMETEGRFAHACPDLDQDYLTRVERERGPPEPDLDQDYLTRVERERCPPECSDCGSSVPGTHLFPDCPTLLRQCEALKRPDREMPWCGCRELKADGSHAYCYDATTQRCKDKQSVSRLANHPDGFDVV